MSNRTQCPECLSTHVGAEEADKTIDCFDCGIWWEADHPNNQPGSPMFGQPLPDEEMTTTVIHLGRRERPVDWGRYDGVPMPDLEGYFD
jgi:hypothetical protein